MKPHLVFSVLSNAALLGSVVAGSVFVPSDLPDALRPAHLVVLGTIHDVSSDPAIVVSPGGNDGQGRVGTAVLDISDVIWGDVPPTASLRVKWEDGFGNREPVESRGIEEGTRGIFFLGCPTSLIVEEHDYRCRITVGDTASVRVWRFVRADRESDVRDLLSRYPLRWHTRPGYFAGKPILMTASFSNGGAAPLRLPRLRYHDGVLTHSEGLRLVVRAGSPNGSDLFAVIDAIVLDATVRNLLLRPGETAAVTMDLSRLFPIAAPGTYYVEMQLDGFPEQMSEMVIVRPSVE